MKKIYTKVNKKKKKKKKWTARTFEWIYKHKKQFTNFALIQSDMAEKKKIKRIFTNIYIYYPVAAA